MLEFSTVAKEPFLFHYYILLLSCSCMVISLHSGIQEPLPVLYHGKDDCIWEIKIEGNRFPAPNTADGHRLPLLNSFITGINVKCAVNGTELLDAIIVARG